MHPHMLGPSIWCAFPYTVASAAACRARYPFQLAGALKNPVGKQRHAALAENRRPGHGPPHLGRWVFARAKSEDKREIVRSRQRQGAVTSMSGEGVNDVPALNQEDFDSKLMDARTVAFIFLVWADKVRR
mmetsp:Transcript_121893/g.389839  ORF Transcript_121893/g.389839 Transcript_121893/m.389839 type:complete len:130 (-) Transcript_121893:80-469(-)